MEKKVLYVSHKKAQCGVYEFGKNITDVLQHSNRYIFIRVECSSLSELQAAVGKNRPDAIIYNYHPSVMPWVATRLGPRLYRSNIAALQVPQIGIIHEITQHAADTATTYRTSLLLNRGPKLVNSLFDYYIAPDPTLLLRNPYVYKTGRLIPLYENNVTPPSKITIGSFGFGTRNKGFEAIVDLVQQEFDQAVIRFNIPAANFGDQRGSEAAAIAKNCKALIRKPGIELIVTHDFLDAKALLDFLAGNTVNVFLYQDTGGRGLSSTIDNALAVRRPIAISDSPMFRHLFDAEPSVRITNNNLRTIIQNGFAPLQKYFNEWNAGNLVWEYERILASVFARQKISTSGNVSFTGMLKSNVRRLLLLPEKNFTWLGNSNRATEDDMRTDTSVVYRPVAVPSGIPFNRILDNAARELYKPAVDKLTELVPKTIAKKIAEANVQQAFVFDTVYRLLPRFTNPKLLCVGCYQDTASMSLKKMGYPVEEIDPMINYSLQEYCTKPTTVRRSYDIVFSTSVIEHDPDDESFMACISALLAPGGIAVITCDYLDGWNVNQPKPECNVRFYTRSDLRDRLLPVMDNCVLFDEPHWDCPNPDFYYLGKYNYTFASLVVRKNP